MKSPLALWFLALTVSTSFSTELYGQKLWSEKDAAAQPLVQLPNFAPLIEFVDQTIVNVAGSSDPTKAQRQTRRRGQQRPGPQGQGPMDPFSNPEEFFEKFFGNPFQDQAPQPKRTLGSGFIISKDGYILTNNHVVEDTDKIEITVLGMVGKNSKKGNTFQAKLVGRDPSTDVALLKVDTGFDLPFVPLADSTKIKKGEWVLAFGNAFGLDHSVSAGIISATGREISPNANRRFDDFIQTDAAINFGNSGGPLVNLRGEVVGINTAITAQGSGIGFAVPINIAKDIIPQLKDKGSVTRGYLGVMIQDVNDEIKEVMGLSAAKGVLVNDVVADGPSGQALKRGDVILKVNGAEVENAKRLQQEVAKVKPGNEVSLEIVREKKPLKVRLKVGALGDEKEQPSKKSEPEGKADKIGLFVDKTPDNAAVQVVDVEPGSVAGEAGVGPGDIIRRVNGTDIKNLDQYKKIVGALKSKSPVVLDLERGNLKIFLSLRLP